MDGVKQNREREKDEVKSCLDLIHKEVLGSGIVNHTVKCSPFRQEEQHFILPIQSGIGYGPMLGLCDLWAKQLLPAKDSSLEKGGSCDC